MSVTSSLPYSVQKHPGEHRSLPTCLLATWRGHMLWRNVILAYDIEQGLPVT